jgi:hypothetical protein
MTNHHGSNPDDCKQPTVGDWTRLALFCLGPCAEEFSAVPSMFSRTTLAGVAFAAMFVAAPFAEAHGLAQVKVD